MDWLVALHVGHSRDSVVSFLGGLILGLMCGGFLGFLLFAILTAAKRADYADPEYSDPYGISARMDAIRRPTSARGSAPSHFPLIRP